MDVDNDPIDPNLLLQFTCLNTTDRDDLIKQFKELIEEVNDDAAEFFLEMNNWNLQNAICAFLDYRSPRNELSMAVVQQPPTFDEFDPLTPNIDFVLVYVLRNDGRETWPRGCTLNLCGGNFYVQTPIPVEALEPNCNTSVILSLKAPSEPGSYSFSLRLTTPWRHNFENILSFSFQVHVKLEAMEEQLLSDELAARMALIDNADCKVMEHEPNTESLGVVANSLSNSIGMEPSDVTDFNQSDRNIS